MFNIITNNKDYKYKVKKILLIDEGDTFYTDLIIFIDEVELDKIKEVINKCKKELNDNYSNEDIYKYLDKEIGIERIDFLDYERVYY